MKLLERLNALWARLWASDEYEVECVGHMHKVVFSAGDVIVVGTDQVLSVEQVLRLEAYVSKRVMGAKVLVLDGGTTLGVVGMPRVAEVDRGAD